MIRIFFVINGCDTIEKFALLPDNEIAVEQVQESN